MHRGLHFLRLWSSEERDIQELLAPESIIFYSKDWKRIGTELDCALLLSQITGIDKKVLIDGTRLRHASIARRMSWASQGPPPGKKMKVIACSEYSTSTCHFFTERAIEPSFDYKKKSLKIQQTSPFSRVPRLRMPLVVALQVVQEISPNMRT